MNTKKRNTTILTIAGSDTGGGAGIQADLKTFAAFGCYGVSVITALTAQNTVTVSAIHTPPARFIAQQLDAVFSDFHIDAVKTGMLKNSSIIRTVAEKVNEYNVTFLVVDPVMVAKSGAPLLDTTAIAALIKYILPRSTIVTPNIPEAEFLTGTRIRTEEDMVAAGRVILDYGTTAVLIKGGHRKEKTMKDCLCYYGHGNELKTKWFVHQKIATNNTHGTGCTLSSAIAALLGKKKTVSVAVQRATDFVNNAIKAGSKYKTGKGHGPLHHFYQYW